jgi:hypothetical protein
VNEFYEASFQEMIDSGSRMVAVGAGPYRSIEIDTVEDLHSAESLFS